MSDAAGRTTAASAHALASEAKSEIERHEAVCAERYIQIAKDIGHMTASITSIRKAGVWATTTGIMTVIGLVGWAGSQWFQTTSADAKADRLARGDQAQQIVFLRNQVTSLTSQLRPGQQVVVAPPGTLSTTFAPPPGAPVAETTP